MAPSKARPAPEDSRSEASSTKEKPTGVVSANPLNGKGRRTTVVAGAPSSLRDVTSAATTLPSSVAAAPGGQETSAGLQWSTTDPEILHSYRHAYNLSTPSAFKSDYNQLILSRGVGRLSPTMARRRAERRQGQDQLANAVRKHFNGMAIQENDVIVEFLYKVKHQDKNFRMRFAPLRPR